MIFEGAGNFSEVTSLIGDGENEADIHQENSCYLSSLSMVAAQMGSFASKSDIDNLYYALVSNFYSLMLKLCRFNQMLIKSIYRALIVLGVAILMASVTVTAAQPSKNAAPEAKKTPTPTPEALWVLNAVGRSDISIFPGKRLSKNTGTIASGGISVTVDGATLDALAFNASGNLWLSFCSGQNASGLRDRIERR